MAATNRIIDAISLNIYAALMCGTLILALAGLVFFSIYLMGRGCSQNRDWRYFRNVSLRNHLWVIYLVILFAFFMHVL